MTLDIKQEYYFPFTFRLFGLVLITLGVFIWTQPMAPYLKSVITIFSWCLAALLITMRYGLWIDSSSKQYKIYLWVLGIKKGKTATYVELEKIYINEVREAASFQTRTSSYIANTTIFKAFLKLEDETKIHLDSDRKREKLEERVEHYRDALKITG